MLISIIVIMSRNGVIGVNNQLPWHLPKDLKWFKTNTLGKPIAMGRKTYESVGKPLPGRENIVITRDLNFTAPGCTVMHSLEAVLEYTKDVEELMIVGGAQIYEQALPLTQRLYLTRVQAEIAGDRYFPSWDPQQWQQIMVEHHYADDKHAYDFDFEILEPREHA